MEPMVKVSREGKHDLHNKDPHVEGPSKRAKLSRSSEPPICKKASTIPEVNQKQWKVKVNHHEASRTTSHHEFSESDKALKRESSITNQEPSEIEGNFQIHVNEHPVKFERAQHRCDEAAEELRKANAIMEAERIKYHHLKQVMEDPFNGLQALQDAVQKKDDESIRKDGVIAAMQEGLDNSKHQAETSKNEVDELRLSLKYFKRQSSEYQNELALRDEKLTSKDRELDKERMDREKAEKAAEAACIINDWNGSRIVKFQKNETAAKNKLKKTQNGRSSEQFPSKNQIEANRNMHAEHDKKVFDLQAENYQLQKRLTDLRTSLKTQKNDYNVMVTDLQLENRELRGLNQRYNHKEPDKKIREDFVRLGSRIRRFVDKIARPVLNITDEELKSTWPSWSPELRKWLGHPLLCSLIFEAYVWECLLKRIFVPWSKVWAGETGHSFEGALRKAADEVAEANPGFESELYIDCQYLRSSLSSLVERLGGGDFLPENFESSVKSMTSTLVKLCGLSEITEEMESDAMGIFKDARDLEIQLRMLKAKYSLVMEHPVLGGEQLKHGFTFADKIMNDRYSSLKSKDLGQTLAVDFIISPCLYKRGNNNGADYKAVMCPVKMGVVCDAAKLFLDTSKSIDAQASSESSHELLASIEVKQEDAASPSRSHEDSAANKATKEEVVISDT
ncbi:hypothetical protein Daus18300_002713 [Diaporthe australafricana]|uniref:Uncharacterized protein n=1 Tax=Diaporthe australafricana TaxID=127596 RepID=A0ABR3XLI3_9PEZI